MKNSDRFHEQQLGQINPEIKNTKLSYNTESILAGSKDNDPIDSETQPVLSNINVKIKAINELKKELNLTNAEIADLFGLSPIAYANSSAKSRYESALCKFYERVKEIRKNDEQSDLNNP